MSVQTLAHSRTRLTNESAQAGGIARKSSGQRFHVAGMGGSHVRKTGLHEAVLTPDRRHTTLPLCQYQLAPCQVPVMNADSGRSVQVVDVGRRHRLSRGRFPKIDVGDRQ